MHTPVGVRWADVAPTLLRPDAVDQAAAESGRLAERVAGEREKVAEAAAAFEQATADDTARMAQALRDGQEPESDTATVERARAALAEAERRLAAAELAAAGADSDVGRLVATQAAAWERACSHELERAQTRARKAIAQLDQALTEIGSARAVAQWLHDVGDRPRPVRASGLSRSPSSEKVTANRSSLNATQVLGFAAELVDPPGFAAAERQA
jgi:hypothetical protein